MNWRERICVNPQVCGGKAVIKGTEVPVSEILDRMAAGTAEKEILDQLPALCHEDVKAAVSYAAELFMVRY